MDVQRPGSYALIDLAQFTTAISQLHNIREELTSSAVCDSWPNFEFPQMIIHCSFEAITNFDKLRKFTVLFHFLRGLRRTRLSRYRISSPEILSSGHNGRFTQLREASVGDYEVLSMLESWLENFQAATPHLRGIVLILRLTHDLWNQPAGNEL